MARFEYVKCVGFGDDRKGAWCKGEEVPFFVDASHAALNGDRKGRLVVCGDCRHEIIKALSNGRTYV